MWEQNCLDLVLVKQQLHKIHTIVPNFCLDLSGERSLHVGSDSVLTGMASFLHSHLCTGTRGPTQRRRFVVRNGQRREQSGIPFGLMMHTGTTGRAHYRYFACHAKRLSRSSLSLAIVRAHEDEGRRTHRRYLIVCQGQ